MLPIKLELSGINSFKTEQCLDFSKLGDSFFGVFGATGSGKSTLLDAITLALYGKIGRARLSSDFINVGCERAWVRFCFSSSIQGEDKTYLIERNFKRKKDLKVEGSAVLYQKIDDSFSVIAEGTFDVDASIKKILGMGIDEFSKCIALPQGQFADFIKSTPNERTGLISNVFSLNGFGAPICDAAKEKQQSLEVAIAQVSGEVSGLGETSAEKLKVVNLQLEKLNENMKQITDELESDSIKFDKIKQVYYKQVQLKNAQEKLDSLNNLKADIEALKERLVKLKAAAPLLENLEELNALANSRARIKADFDEAQAQLKQTTCEFEAIKAEYEKINSNFSEDYTKLLAQISTLESLKTKEKEQQEAYVNLSKVNAEILEIQNQKTEQSQKIETLKTTQSELELRAQKIQEEVKGLEVDNALVLQIKKGVEIQSQIDVLNKISTGLDELESTLRNQKKSLENELETSEQDFEKVREKIADSVGEIVSVGAKKDTIIKEKLKAQTDEIRLENAKSELDFLSQIMASFDKSVEEKLKKKTALSSERAELENAQNDAKNKLQEARINFEKVDAQRERGLVDLGVFILFNDAKIGEACPVCSQKISSNLNARSFAQEVSIEDKNSAFEAVEVARRKVNNLDLQLEIKTAEIDGLDAAINFDKSQKQLVLQKYSAIESAFVSPFENENLNQKIENTKQKNSELSKRLTEIEKYEADIHNLVEKIANIKGQISGIDDSFNAVEAHSKKVFEMKNERKQVVVNLEKRLGGQNILSVSGIIEDNESKLGDLEQKLSSIVAQKRQIELEIGLGNSKLNEFQYSLDLKQSAKNQLETKIKKLNEEIESVDADGVGIEKLLSKARAELSDLETLHNSLEKRKVGLESKKLGAENQVKLDSVKLKECQDNFEQKNEKFNHFLNINGFDDIEVLRSFNSTEHERNQIEIKLNDYNSSTGLVKAEIEQLSKDLSGVDVDTAQTAEIELRIESNKAIKGDLAIEIGRVMGEAALIEKNLAKKLVLEEKLTALNADLDYAKILVKLLRGKALAQFVCDEYLEEITLRANQIAQLLLDGKFTLRFCDGEFFVEDNLNGGLSRAVSTLSGGETFLISLALALSISETIAAASGKNMDFFFLDEGFGTLDNELCEAVVAALYKLETKNLKIGVISHIKELVERIKNKVLVTKTEEDGSVIKLDFSL